MNGKKHAARKHTSHYRYRSVSLRHDEAECEDAGALYRSHSRLYKIRSPETVLRPAHGNGFHHHPAKQLGDNSFDYWDGKCRFDQFLPFPGDDFRRRHRHHPDGATGCLECYRFIASFYHLRRKSLACWKNKMGFHRGSRFLLWSSVLWLKYHCRRYCAFA